MYDAIVVGARVAGSTTAMLLARRGYKVLMLDKATFPSDTLSTHYIHVAGCGLLAEWGLLDRLAATGCTPIRDGVLDFGEFQLKGAPPPAGNTSVWYAPRRTVLDKLLIDAAVESGVTFREGCAVEGLLFDGKQVTGVRCPSPECARIVIGADGMRSRVAQAVQAPAYHEKPPLSCGYYSYWSGTGVKNIQLYIRDRFTVIGFPTHDDLACIVYCAAISDFSKIRSDIEGSYLRAVDQAPELAERVNAGKRESRFMGTSDLPNFFRKPYGDGWALVGDAGYHKDPLTAEGITDAFRGAALLSEAIDAGFSGEQPLADTLAAYEEKRNELALPIYELTLQRAGQEPPPPEFIRLLLALRGNPEQINRFLGVDAGTVRPQDFFARENIGAIMAAA